MSSEDKTSIEYFCGAAISGRNLFGDLPPQTLASFARIKHKASFEKGERIFARGDVPKCVYLLLKGRAQMSSEGGQQSCLIEPDKILGLTEMLADAPCKTNFETVTPCLCERVSREDLIGFLRGEPEICFRLARLLSRSIQKSYRESQAS